MKAHTSEFKENIKLLGRQQESKITYGEMVLSGESLNSITPKFEGSILKSVMKELIIDSNVEIPLKTIINYQYGLKTSVGYEYLDFGNYEVQSVEKQEDSSSYLIKCYDKMLNTMKDYEAVDITYPCSVRDYINAICTKLNITFANSSTTFSNYNQMLEKDFYQGLDYTYRDVFDELAEVTASMICINSKDELEIRYINDTKDTIDEKYLKDINVNFGEKYGPINSIVLSRSAESDSVFLQDEASVQANGLTEIKIKNNQIMNFNNRSDYLQGILDALNGMEFYINDYVSTGIVYYEPYDRYNVKIGDKTYSCVMLNDEINITQGLSENIYTKRPEQSKTEYKKADKTDRRINQAYIIVDKQNQTIDSVVQKTEGFNEGIESNQEQIQKLTTQITQNSNEIKVSISKVENLGEQIEANNKNTQEELNKINNSLENGVENLKNTLVTINAQGIKVSTNLSTITTIMTNEKFSIETKSGQTLAFFGYDNESGKTLAKMDNLTITNYFMAGYHRQERMSNGHTGWFYIKGGM